ncbi:hypothetical protein N657DRAFT_646488 [Parathielavia appendiculata]|uniref:Uncharacterized protein n=1 Tax=Parathielavia appendiculata TaxID=2587402 RepID=A0AAN6TY15_9PEZI|nr:hypothetical protein N657DRAFT_646488 [Parathielavia appendiculata]
MKRGVSPRRPVCPELGLAASKSLHQPEPSSHLFAACHTEAGVKRQLEAKEVLEPCLEAGPSDMGRHARKKPAKSPQIASYIPDSNSEPHARADFGHLPTDCKIMSGASTHKSTAILDYGSRLEAADVSTSFVWVSSHLPIRSGHSTRVDWPFETSIRS